MVKKKGQGIEALTVRRSDVADGGKVRYRVYTSKSEFVAVIAESALMAMKVSGISDPFRIVRDLPVEGVALGAERMTQRDDSNRVTLALEPKIKETPIVAGPSPCPRPSKDRSSRCNWAISISGKAGRWRILRPEDWAGLTGSSSAPPPAPEPAPAAPAPAAAAADEETLSADEVAKLLNE